MCDYQGYEFGAGAYPDSVCIDGFLFDADHCDSDGNIYDNGESIPCPICSPVDSVNWWFERNVEDEECADDVLKSKNAALSLVNDIRKNRGYEAVKDD